MSRRRPRITDPEIMELIDGPPAIIRTEADFRDYQGWMVEYLLKTPYALLAAHMGLGKTAAVLKVIETWLAQRTVRKVLIVAPLRVAENTWPEEFRGWDFARKIRYSVVIGSADERAAAALDDAPVHIVNRENVAWLWKFWKARKMPWPYDALVYDEASRLKRGSKRTAIAKRADGTKSGMRLSEFGALANARARFRRVVELSGTPAPNGLIDLWGPAYILDHGRRLGTDRDAFVARWFKTSKFSYEIKPFDHSEEQIMSKLADVMVTLRKEDYLKNLPPLVVNDLWVRLSDKAQVEYDRFEKTMAYDRLDVEAVTNGVLTNKLLQCANGGLYHEDGTYSELHDLKLNALESVIEEAAGAPMLVAYSFRFDLERILKRFPWFRVFKTAADLRDWNSGKLRGMLIHPASAGHGMNFQYGGNIFVWYGLNWSLELYQQTNERLPRSGQKADRVFMHRILTRDTMDEDQLFALDAKGATQDSIMNAVRVRAARVTGTDWCDDDELI